VPQLIEAVRRMHSYAVPCIVTLPVATGHQPFLDWVAAETRTPGESPEGA
jgi:periplasmic divalent cation tolerance protein